MYNFSDETYYEDDSELEMDLKESNFRQNYQNSANQPRKKERLQFYAKKHLNNIITIDCLFIILFSFICLFFNVIIIKIVLLLFAVHLFIKIFKKGDKIE